MDDSIRSPSAVSPNPPPRLNPLTEAMRADLKKLLDGEIFDSGVLKNLIRKAKAAQQYLMADALMGSGGEILNDDLDSSLGSPGSLLYGGGTSLGGLGASLNSETFGAKIIREVFPMLADLERVKQQSPEKLVDAIAAANEAGMTDLADMLKERLLGADAAKLGAVEPGLVSRAGTPMEYGSNVQLGSQVTHPAVKAIADEVNGKSLRELATDPDA